MGPPVRLRSGLRQYGCSRSQRTRHLPFGSLTLASGPYRAIFGRVCRRWTLAGDSAFVAPGCIFERDAEEGRNFFHYRVAETPADSRLTQDSS